MLKYPFNFDDGFARDTGILLLRLSAGLLLLYYHGGHKFRGFIAYVHSGQPWELVGEIMQMHLHWPFAIAVFVTIVQCLGSLLLIVGLYTRPSSALLVVVLSGAIFQNLHAGRDPQLAVLYTLIALTLILLGGGRYTLSVLLRRRSPDTGER